MRDYDTMADYYEDYLEKMLEENYPEEGGE